MPFADFPVQQASVQLLQRSLARGRLGHAYLFTGDDLGVLEELARLLAQTVNCQNPAETGPDGLPLDACGECRACQRTERVAHPDVHWVRPESKLRVITMEQIRELMQSVYLKPNEGRYKIGIVVGADRLNVQSANAFLKTLEEPPARSILVLLTTEPYRILDTISSRCLRLNVAGGIQFQLTPERQEWLERFSQLAAREEKSLLSRYKLLDHLLTELAKTRRAIDERIRSGADHLEDLEPKARERVETELNASVEAEYRRERSDLLTTLEWWLRDIWLVASGLEQESLVFPDRSDETNAVSRRISPEEARENLESIESMQGRLHSNVQEALTLEVGLLKLNF